MNCECKNDKPHGQWDLVVMLAVGLAAILAVPFVVGRGSESIQSIPIPDQGVMCYVHSKSGALSCVPYHFEDVAEVEEPSTQA